MTNNSPEEPNNGGRILLEETFYVLTKKNCVFRVRLTKSGLSLIKESESNVKEQLIPISDIIGGRCLRSKKQNKGCTCQSMSMPRSSSLKVVEENSLELDDSDVSAYLYIYAYILQQNKGSVRRRDRTVITLRFRSFDKYEDNYKEAQKWRTVIKRLIKGDNFGGGPVIDFATLAKHKEDRRLLVLCNPKSGAGKGRTVFQEKVAPILQEAEVPYDLHITKHANFAREFVRTCNIYQWTGILVVGGDGIVFEALNGIFERWDWAECLKHIPIGVVPSGSGNGLARSIAHHCAEPYQPAATLPAALAAVRHRRASMDLVRVETTGRILFSFLSVGWGLLSDIDVESERLRVLGGQRFTVWSVARLIGLRSYGGRLWYLPAHLHGHPQDEKQCGGGGGDHGDPDDGSPRHGGGGALELPGEFCLETQTGRQRVDSWYSAASRRSAYFSTTGSSYQSTADSCEGNATNGDPSSVRMYGPASQLPCLTAPLPSSWKCIEGRFVMVHASYQSHLGEDCLFAPEARLNDGMIWLLIVRAGASRSQVLQFLLGLSTGAHINQTEDGIVELLPVVAFRIEPDVSEKGYMTVDGEHVEYGPVQGEIFPELARVMVP